jgi:hypothetical protein
MCKPSTVLILLAFGRSSVRAGFRSLLRRELKPTALTAADLSRGGHVGRLLGALTLITLSTVTPTSAEQAQAAQTLISKADRVSMTVPTNWSVQRDVASGPVRQVFVTLNRHQSSSDTFNENCSLIAIPDGPPVTLDALFRRPEPGARSLKDFGDLGKRIVSIGGGRAVRTQHEHTMEGARLRVLQYTFIRHFAESGRSGFVLTCTAPASAFAAWEPTFDSIARSVAFPEP